MQDKETKDTKCCMLLWRKRQRHVIVFTCYLPNFVLLLIFVIKNNTNGDVASYFYFWLLNLPEKQCWAYNMGPRTKSGPRKMCSLLELSWLMPLLYMQLPMLLEMPAFQSQFYQPQCIMLYKKYEIISNMKISLIKFHNILIKIPCMFA